MLVRYVVGVDTFLRFGCQKKIADGDGIALHNIIVCVSVWALFVFVLVDK